MSLFNSGLLKPSFNKDQPNYKEVLSLYVYGQELSKHLDKQVDVSDSEPEQSQIEYTRSLLAGMDGHLRGLPSDKAREEADFFHTTLDEPAPMVSQCRQLLMDLEKTLRADTLQSDSVALIEKVKHIQKSLYVQLQTKMFADTSAMVFRASQELQKSHDSAFASTSQVEGHSAEDLEWSVGYLNDQLIELSCTQYVRDRLQSSAKSSRAIETHMPEANKTDIPKTNRTDIPEGTILTENGDMVALQLTFTKGQFSDLLSSFQSINGQKEELCLSVQELVNQLGPAMNVVLCMEYLSNHPETKTS